MPTINMPNAPTMITSYIGGKQMREYVHYVDLSPRAANPVLKEPGIRGIIYTHFPKSEVSSFFSGMSARYLLTAFNSKMKSVPSNPERAWVTLMPRVSSASGEPFSFDENTRHTANLLNYLTTRGFPIIWKEDKHGYEITAAGYIKRKWELDPF